MKFVGNPQILIVILLMLSGCTALPKSVSHNIEMAKQGDAQAQYKLGLDYTNGFGVTQNYATATDWFLKAAQQGQIDAQFMVAVAYASGRGVKRNEN